MGHFNGEAAELAQGLGFAEIGVVSENGK